MPVTPAAAALTLAALALAPEATEAERVNRCDAPGAKRTIATESARVFRVPGGRSFACLYRVGRRVSLGSSYVGAGPTSSTLSQLRLAGAYVAYARLDYDHDSSVSRVVVRDLRSGRIVHSADPLRGTVPVDAVVSDLELTATGAVAWITRDQSSYPPAHFEVWKADAETPRPVRLDAGADIAPASLALSGSIVYWTRAGAPASAPLR